MKKYWKPVLFTATILLAIFECFSLFCFSTAPIPGWHTTTYVPIEIIKPLFFLSLISMVFLSAYIVLLKKKRDEKWHSILDIIGLEIALLGFLNMLSYLSLIFFGHKLGYFFPEYIWSVYGGYGNASILHPLFMFFLLILPPK